MKIESPDFTDADLDQFLNEMWGHELGILADRLKAVSERLSRLAQRNNMASASASNEWSAHETLAHIASASRYYGVLAYRIVRGDAGIEWMNDLRGRDLAIQDLTTEAIPADLIAMTLTAHRRTLDWLEGASIADLTRRQRIGEGRTYSAEEIIRLGLCAHVEMHLHQMEQALARGE